MCRIKLLSKAMMVLSLAYLAGTAGLQSAFADANPVGCQPASDVGIAVFCVQNGVTNSVTGQTLVVGETVLYQARLFQNDNGNCGFEGGQIDITLPNNVTVNATLGETIPLICGSSGCNPAGISTFFSQFVPYTVSAADVGTSRSGVTPCNPSPTNQVQAKASYTGGISHCDANNSCDPSSSISLCNRVVVRGLSATKLVACTTNLTCSTNPSDYSGSASGAQFGSTNPQFCYSVTITNTGTAALLITNVSDDVLGDLTASFPGGLATNSGATVLVGPRSESSTATDTLTVLGREVVSCQQLPVSATSSATANVVPSTISCLISFVQNGVTLSGNSGNCSACGANVGIIPSANSVSVVVTVTNNAGNGQNILSGSVKVGTSTFSIPGPIAPGNTGSVTIDTVAGDAQGCHNYAADVVFAGALTDSCPPIPTSCANSLEICGTGSVQIVKLVKCMTDTNPNGECETGLCSSDLSLYAPSATGVTDAGFCYGIEIINTGTIPLTNVVVVDNQLGNPLPGYPSTLEPGQSATNFFQKVYPGLVGDVRNTATVTGQSSSGEVTANTNALVTLLRPGITCAKTVSLNGGTPSSGGSLEVTAGSTNDLVFSVNVCNNGDVDLQNVLVIDTGASGCGLSTNTIDSLAQGACTNITLCSVTNIVLTCPPAESLTLTNIVNVSAQVSTNVCSVSPVNCQHVTTSSSCTNTITLTTTCITPSACRTTGGGKQFNVCQSSRVPTPVPQYVTHGGQVGAPFAVATQFAPNTPCIRGEWTHVRHISPKLDGNFHAASNGHVHDFDSLECACLPCPSLATTNPACPPTGAVGTCLNVNLDYTNTIALASGGKRFALCDVDAPPQPCGPEPRHAPANKICFSGLGDYALTKGKRAKQSVVFRVDIEDRGEPGNSQAIGSAGKPNPPDRYRMRIWFTNGLNAAQVLALRCQVACRDPLMESVCAPCPDIDDGGDLNDGNRQIHPPTGAPVPANCPDLHTPCASCTPG